MIKVLFLAKYLDFLKFLLACNIWGYIIACTIIKKIILFESEFELIMFLLCTVISAVLFVLFKD